MKSGINIYSVSKLLDRSEIDTLVEIWLEGSKTAHHFIEPSYWQNHAAAMKETYIPQSETWLFRDNTGRIAGLVSLMDNYLAALFVHPQKQGQGIGGKLMAKAKELKSELHLAVYAKNKSAVNFYQKSGFSIHETRIDPQTGEEELVMVWNKSV